MKRAAKRIVSLLALAATWPLAALARWTSSESLFVGFGQALALIPGLTGSYLRAAYLRQTLKHASNSCRIGFGSYFSHREASLAEGVYIGAYCIIGMADIGAHATIASRVSILSGRRQHAFDDATPPIQQQGGAFSRVRIGENSWIGEGSVVMADIGDRCVVGAGSVVTKDHDGGLVLAGNPARVPRHLEGQP